MKKQFKKVLLLMLVVLMFMPLSVFAENNIKLWINGNFANSDVPPIIKNDRTLVPIRIISENLGYSVSWNNSDKSVDITKENSSMGSLDHAISLKIGEKNLIIYDVDTINNDFQKFKNTESTLKEISELSENKGTVMKLDVAPIIINDRTYVPIRAIAELFGEKVTWDAQNRVVAIGKNYVPKKEDSKKVENVGSFKYDSSLSNEQNIKNMRSTYDKLSYSNDRNMSYSEFCEDYHYSLFKILSQQANKLSNNSEFKKLYPSYDEYLRSYNENLKNYINFISDEIDMTVGGNYELNAADFTIYEIYRLDNIYNKKDFDYNKYVLKNDLEMSIILSRMVYDKVRDNVNKLPAEFKNMLGEHTITKDSVPVRFGPGLEFELYDNYKKGRKVEIFDIAYADGMYWVNVAQQECFFIPADSIK